MKIDLTIELEDHDDLVVTTGMADAIALERRFDVAAATAFETAPRMEHLAFMGWNALRRRRRLPDALSEFDDFIDQVAGITAVGDDEEESPQGEAAAAES